MVLPRYVECQWAAEGKALLKFQHNSVTEDEDSDGKQITCFMSSLYIREYEKKDEEKISNVDEASDELQNVEASDELQNVDEASDELQIAENETSKCPPDVLPTIWEDWCEWWKNWEEILVSLSWIRKYRKICKPSSIEWYDGYIEDFPTIVPMISDCWTEEQIDTTLLESNINEGNEDNQAPSEKPDDETLDRMYKEFSNLRYWVHLGRFLQVVGIEASNDLNKFFLEKIKVSYDSINVNNEVYNSYAADYIIPPYIRNRLKSFDPTEDETNEIDENEHRNEINANNICNNDKVVTDDQLNNQCKINESMTEAAVVDDGEESYEMLHRDECHDNDKMGMKRRQEDTSNLNYVEDMEKLIEVKNKKPRYISDISNRELSEDVDDLQVHENCEYIEDNDSCSENKENIQAKKCSKSKKKKRAVKKAGLGWALKYFQSNDKLQTESVQDNENEQNCNIFSVSESPSMHVRQDSIGSLSVKDDYEFRAEELNLNENCSELSKCFTEKRTSICNDDNENSDINDLLSSLNKRDYIEKSEIDKDTKDNVLLQNDEACSVNSKNIIDSANIADKIKNSNSEDKDGKIVSKRKIRTVKPKPEGKNFMIRCWDSVKNFVVMCASHFFNFIIPSAFTGYGRLGLFSVENSGIFSFLRKYLGYRTLPEKRNYFNHKKLHKWIQQKSNTDINICDNYYLKEFYKYDDDRLMESVYQSLEMANDDSGFPYVVVKPIGLENDSGDEVNDIGDEWQRAHIFFDDEGNPITESQEVREEPSVSVEQLRNCRLMKYKIDNDDLPPAEIPSHLHKYWAQRHRLFFRYDEGIKLDEESWYSVTPELIAAHHAYRCKCDVVIDAFCGSGGNAIQLASTCNRVIAIDIDPAKIELARHNAAVYGLEDNIDFIVGDFFELAPTLNADVILLSPPWGGTEYINDKIYDVKKLGGTMNCNSLMKTARKITNNIVLYLPRSSNLCQIIELAGVDGTVDLEYNYMGNKRKALTAYFGDLVYTESERTSNYRYTDSEHSD